MPFYKITVKQKYQKDLNGIRWFPQHDMDTIREKVLKALHEQKSPVMVDTVDIVQLPDDDPEVKRMEDN